MSDPRALADAIGDALRREPLDASLRYRHAQALKAAGDVNGAVRTLAEGVRLAPRDVERWLALAGLLMEIELAAPERRRPGAAEPLPRAMQAVEHALALAPADPAVLAQAAMTFRYACAWSRAEPCIAALDDAGADAKRRFSVSPMMATALIDDPALQARAIRDFATHALPAAAPRSAAVIAHRGDRLRVGYLSSDFHDHATAHLCAGLFEHHDRARVTPIAYALDSDDGSAMRARLKSAFAHWRDVRDADDAAAAEVIERDDLDVLVDLKGHTHGSRMGILARRPAPVQIHYLGFPGTIAHAAVDAQVADAIVVPHGDESLYDERILRLPVCYQANDRRRPLPPPASRASIGLPERALVLVCFNQTYKLSRPFFDAWLDVLERHDDAVLWLNVPHAMARANLHAAAAARGIEAARIVFASFAPQAVHLARLRCADVALDVLPYGSHTTGSDALWCGVPMLTLTGRTFAGRVATSLVHAAGIPELAVDSMARYVATLDELAADRERLAALKAKLDRDRYVSPLFDTGRFTRDFERLLEDAAALRASA